MSIINIQIRNEAKEEKDEILKFMKEFNRLNKNLGFLSQGVSNKFISNDVREKYIIPDGFYAIVRDNSQYTYIGNGKSILFQLSYFPYSNMESETLGHAQIMKPFKEENFISEKEYILEKACLVTAKKHGLNFLRGSIEALKQGNYNGFSRDNNAREDLRKVSSKELSTLMVNTLSKDEKTKYIIKDALNVNDVEEIYYAYLGSKLNNHMKL